MSVGPWNYNNIMLIYSFNHKKSDSHQEKGLVPLGTPDSGYLIYHSNYYIILKLVNLIYYVLSRN